MKIAYISTTVKMDISSIRISGCRLYVATYINVSALLSLCVWRVQVVLSVVYVHGL